MEDRAQVILIITGLGGTTIEATLSGAEKLMPTQQPVAQTYVETSRDRLVTTAAQYPVEPPPVELSATTTNLDLPAFLRRRTHFAA
jgi:hypothetical protein